MATIMELRTKRANLWEGAKAFLDSHMDSDGKLSAEDAAAYDKMEADVVELGHDIERLERQAALDRELSQPTAAPILTAPQADCALKTGRASTKYREDMLTALRSGFRQVSNDLQEGVDTDGGYLVPTEYDTRLIDVLEDENIIRSLGTKLTTSGERKINIAATKPAALWVEEGGALAFGDATFDQIILDAHKLHVAIKVTEELLYDNAFGLESYIISQFGKALANAEEDAFLNGDGSHKPTGLLTTAEVGVTTTGNTVTADDVISLIYALKRPYRKSAAFIVNDQTLAVIRTLKDQNKAYMWQPSYQLGEPDRLLGYPVYTTPHMPTVASGAAVIAFGDFSYYNIGDRGSRSIQELRELFAGNGMIGFVMKERVDGKLVLPEAVKTLKIKASA